MKPVIIIFALITAVSSCNNADKRMTEKEACSEKCMDKNKKEISCKLTTPKLQKRRATVIESLKSQLLEKRELKHGYAFRFPGTDKMIDELTEFIKTERECCDFFTFNLSVAGDKSEAWLELIGEEGVKDFISDELGM